MNRARRLPLYDAIRIVLILFILLLLAVAGAACLDFRDAAVFHELHLPPPSRRLDV